MKFIYTFCSALVLFGFTANAFSAHISSTRSSYLAPFAVRVRLDAKTSGDNEKGVLGTTKDLASDVYSKTKDFVKGKAGIVKDAAVGAKDYVKDTVVHAKDAILGDTEATIDDVQDKADDLSETTQGYVKEQVSNAADSVSNAADDFKEEVNEKDWKKRTSMEYSDDKILPWYCRWSIAPDTSNDAVLSTAEQT